MSPLPLAVPTTLSAPLRLVRDQRQVGEIGGEAEIGLAGGIGAVGGDLHLLVGDAEILRLEPRLVRATRPESAPSPRSTASSAGSSTVRFCPLPSSVRSNPPVSG